MSPAGKDYSAELFEIRPPEANLLFLVRELEKAIASSAVNWSLDDDDPVFLDTMAQACRVMTADHSYPRV